MDREDLMMNHLPQQIRVCHHLLMLPYLLAIHVIA
jgi:hypothetical protein